MNYNITNDLLPIGSVVTIRFNQNRFMIIGHKMKNDNDNKIYDYLAVYYPLGLHTINELSFFNRNIIKKVHFFGYTDEEGNKYLSEMENDNNESSDIEVLQV